MRVTKFTAVSLGLLFQTACASFTDDVNFSTDPADFSSSGPCEGKKACRPLTVGEVEMAREYFGDTIDYKTVGVMYRPDSPLAPMFGGMSPDGNVYMFRKAVWSEDYSKAETDKRGFFGHEMLHVWQVQNGRNLYLEALPSALGYVFAQNMVYKYTLGKKFNEYGLEQQASMLQQYIEQRDVWRMPESLVLLAGMKSHCPDLVELENTIATALPIKKYFPNCIL